MLMVYLKTCLGIAYSHVMEINVDGISQNKSISYPVVLEIKLDGISQNMYIAYSHVMEINVDGISLTSLYLTLLYWKSVLMVYLRTCKYIAYSHVMEISVEGISQNM